MRNLEELWGIILKLNSTSKILSGILYAQKWQCPRKDANTCCQIWYYNSTSFDNEETNHLFNFVCKSLNVSLIMVINLYLAFVFCSYVYILYFFLFVIMIRYIQKVRWINKLNCRFRFAKKERIVFIYVSLSTCFHYKELFFPISIPCFFIRPSLFCSKTTLRMILLIFTCQTRNVLITFKKTWSKFDFIY